MLTMTVAEYNAAKTPLKAIRRPVSEEREHIQLAQIIRLRLRPDVAWWHTPNGGNRNAVTGGKLKAMGTRRGFPDLAFLRDGQLYLLEFKPERGGRLSPEQIECMEAMTASGAVCAVARGVEAAVEQIEAWGLFKP